VNEKLLNRRQAAEKIGVSEQTLSELRRQGHLQALRIGRVFRYRMCDLENFVKANSVNPSEFPKPEDLNPESSPSLIAFGMLSELRLQTRILGKLVRQQ